MIKFHDNEEIQHEIPVDLRQNIDYISGTLFITDQRFIFEPRHMHFRREIMKFNINEINNIDASEILGIVPNGMTLELKDGSLHTFVLDSSHIMQRDDIMTTVWDLMRVA